MIYSIPFYIFNNYKIMYYFVFELKIYKKITK